MFIVGSASALGSIPLFIMSGKNKKRAAAAVSLKMENYSRPYKQSLVQTSFPAVGVKLRL
jgi:hypothetical protein